MSQTTFRAAYWALVLLSPLAFLAPLRAQELYRYEAAPEAEVTTLPGSYGETAIDSESEVPPFVFTGADILPPPVDPQVLAALQAQEERLAKLEKNAAAPAKLKYPNVAINGVFQADGVATDQTDVSRAAYGPIQGGADFRRARLAAKGAVTDNMNYFFQMDFAFFGRPTFTDVWVDFTQLPVLGTFRIGQWKQPFSLEVVSSFRYTTFMERAGTFLAFTPFRHTGFGFYNNSEDLYSTWAVSYFRTGQDQFGGSLSTLGGNGMAARGTRLLYWDDECNGYNYWHVGAGYYLNAPPNHVYRSRTIPEIYVGEQSSATLGSPPVVGSSGNPTPTFFNGTPFFIDTGNLAFTSVVQTGGLESLWVRGPLSVQAEGMGQLVDRGGGNPNLWFTGGYVTTGYFLTGEHRPYDRKAGAIDRVIPFNNFDRCGGGIGAWEIAGRLSNTNLISKNVNGGRMLDATLGVNWYVNPYCKCVFNYIHSWTDSPFAFNPAGTSLTNTTPTGVLRNTQSNFYGVRCQLDF